MKNRYRYILSGIALGKDKVSDFRLIAGNMIKPSYNGASVLRVNIPANLELTKDSCNPYSTTEDNRTLDELGYDVLIWNSKSKRWDVNNSLKGLNPCDFPICYT